ncbi:MAG: AMP-binding protein, partial [Rhodospirillales bacterium]|nr:AMP-binding protein [Rhodospirillales bacterium]
MSEIAPVSSNRVDGVRKVGSVGQPNWDTEVQIVDLESGSKILPVGEAGEIRTRGPHAMKSYRNRPEETKIAVRDGWIYTGDIGRIDEDGFIFIVDRKKEMAIVGGYNVFPREVEEILFSHPAVQDAAALGVPDDYKGEVIWAYVVLKNGADAAEQDFLELCSANLVAYKRPVGVTIISELPKTPANKPDKKALLALHVKGT